MICRRNSAIEQSAQVLQGICGEGRQARPLRKALQLIPRKPESAPCGAGGVPEPLEGQCGFGSAVQAVLRYLGGAAASPELAARLGSNAAASSSDAAANGKPGLAGNSYAGTCSSEHLAGKYSGRGGTVFRNGS